jgi:hypothetical protein
MMQSAKNYTVHARAFGDPLKWQLAALISSFVAALRAFRKIS